MLRQLPLGQPEVIFALLAHAIGVGGGVGVPVDSDPAVVAQFADNAALAAHTAVLVAPLPVLAPVYYILDLYFFL